MFILGKRLTSRSINKRLSDMRQGKPIRGKKAEAVKVEIVKVLAEGETVQNELINRVARNLPEIDPNTVNSLVRRALNSNSNIFTQRRDTTGNRKYWDIEFGAIFQAYDSHLIDLKNLSTGVLKHAPSSYDLTLWEVLSKSGKLRNMVDEDFHLVFSSYLNFLMRGEKKTGIRRLDFCLENGVDNFLFDHMLKVLIILGDDEKVREQVGIELFSKLLSVSRQFYQELENRVVKPKTILEEMERKLKTYSG